MAKLSTDPYPQTPPTTSDLIEVPGLGLFRFRRPTIADVQAIADRKDRLRRGLDQTNTVTANLVHCLATLENVTAEMPDALAYAEITETDLLIRAYEAYIAWNDALEEYWRKHKRRAAAQNVSSLLEWYKRHYNLPPTDPRLLATDDLTMEYSYLLDRKYRQLAAGKSGVTEIDSDAETEDELIALVDALDKAALGEDGPITMDSLHRLNGPDDPEPEEEIAIDPRDIFGSR